MRVLRQTPSPALWRQLAALLALAGSVSCSEGASPRSERGPTRDPAPYATPPPPPPLTPATDPQPCLDDGVLEISVEIWDQQGLDRLAGCERLVGDLYLNAFPGLDYAPLRSLRDVEGTLMVWGSDEPETQLLEGLRALEEAGGLELSHLQLDSLESLTSLRRLGARTSNLPPRPETLDKVTAPEDRSYVEFYGLSIDHCAGLTSLADLASLQELDALHLSDNPELVSLAGLDSLEKLDQLQLRDNPLLVNLGGLSHFLELPELQLVGGVVELRGALPVRNLSVVASAWTDLSALGDARGLESLELQGNPALVTLTGAQLPERLEQLGISDNPVLANLQGLEALREIDRLWIATGVEDLTASQLTSLEGLSGLERVGRFELYGQTRLPNLTGLDALKEIETFELRQNTALESLEGLSSLERVADLSLGESSVPTQLSGLGNARISRLWLSDVGIVDLGGLEQVIVEQNLTISRTPALASLRGLPQLGPDASLSLTELFALTDAQALQDVTALGALELQHTAIAGLSAPGLQTLGALTVWQNPELVQLSLSALRTLDTVRLLANESLLRVDLRQLESVHQLEITNNDQLYRGSLEVLLELGAESVEIDSNGSRPPRLNPCPWTGDELCDETSRLCAEGTDAADCAAP